VSRPLVLGAPVPPMQHNEREAEWGSNAASIPLAVTSIRRLSDVHDANTFLAPRVFPEFSEWLPRNSYELENLTATYIPLAGSMPVLCHSGGATETSLAVLRDAEIPVAETVIRYADEAEYVAAIRDLLNQKLRAVTVYRTPSRVLPDGSTWIDQALQSHLNNKGRIDELLPAGHASGRTYLPRRDAVAALKRYRLPLVVKVASDLPSAAGSDVAICRARRHVIRALERFAAAEALVVEPFLNIVRNDCLHFGIRSDGHVAYLGATEQICNRHGAHLGNWFDDRNQPPEAAVTLATEIAQNAAARGYCGLAGLDIVTTGDGEVYAIDLNFRPASSSAQLLLDAELRARRGHAVSRLVFSRFDGPVEQAASRLRTFMDRGCIVPLVLFDPASLGKPSDPAYVRFLALGQNKSEADARVAEVAQLGFRIAGWREPSWFKRLTRRVH
jgi:hypothetical protein